MGLATSGSFVFGWAAPGSNWCLQLLKQSATIEMFVLTRPSRRGIMNI